MTPEQKKYVTCTKKKNGFLPWDVADVERNESHGLCFINPKQHSGAFAGTVSSYARSGFSSGMQHLNCGHDYQFLYLMMLSNFIFIYHACNVYHLHICI